MGEVVEFNRKDLDKKRKLKTQNKAKGKTLCKSGFHKWEIDKKKQFDVKSGKLVTVYRCSRGGELKVKAH